MEVKGKDIALLADTLIAAWEQGNRWCTYPLGKMISIPGELNFFSSEAAAFDFSILYQSEGIKLSGREIAPLFYGLQQFLSANQHQHEPYWISISGGAPPVIQRHAIAEQVITSDALRALQDSLKVIGMEDKVMVEVVEGVRQGNPRFQVRVSGFYGEDKMEVDLLFCRQDNDQYVLTAYDAVLQKPVPIADDVINGVSLRELESRMKIVDWSEGAEAALRSNGQVTSSILKDIEKLDYRNRVYLEAKYWSAAPMNISPVRQEIYKLIKNSYQFDLTVQINDPHKCHVYACYQYLNGKAALLDDLLKQIPPAKIISTFLNKQTMNTENLEYLKNQVKYSGFGESHHADLEKNIRAGENAFVLTDTSQKNGVDRTAKLNFKQGDKNEMYFFNHFDASVKLPDGTERSQRFFIEKNNGYTKREAFNQLEGRAVNKDLTTKSGKEYNAWVELDFSKQNKYGNNETRQYHQNFGYDLQKAVERLPLKENNDPKLKGDNIKDLKKGDLVPATLNTGETISITADPSTGKANKVKVYDKGGVDITDDFYKSLRKEKKNTTASESGTTQATSGEAKKTSASQSDELLEKNDKKKGSKKGMTGKDSGDELMPKNRQSTGKGISL